MSLAVYIYEYVGSTYIKIAAHVNCAQQIMHYNYATSARELHFLSLSFQKFYTCYSNSNSVMIAQYQYLYKV